MNKDTQAIGVCVSLTEMCVNSSFFKEERKSVKIWSKVEDTNEIDH